MFYLVSGEPCMVARSTKVAAVKPGSTAERKVPLHEAQSQLQTVEELLTQLEVLAISEPVNDLGLSEDETARLIQQKQQAIALELRQIQQENQAFYEQAVNRMLNRAAFETRQWVGQEAIAKYYRTQASVLSQEVDRSKKRIQSIKGTIASSLQMLEESRFRTTQHKMHLITSVRVEIREDQVPELEGLIALNAKYPGILSQLKFNESGRLVGVEFRRDVLKQLLKTEDDEVLDDLYFAALREEKHLVVPTISEAGIKKQVRVSETEYAAELEWQLE